MVESEGELWRQLVSEASLRGLTPELVSHKANFWEGAFYRDGVEEDHYGTCHGTGVRAVTRQMLSALSNDE